MEFQGGPVVARHKPKRDEIVRWVNSLTPDESDRKIMPATLASDIADGFMIARMMLQWGMISKASFKRFRQGRSNDIALQNYKMLEPVFRVLQLNMTPKKAASIIKGEQRAAVDLLCDLKFTFEGRPARGPLFNQDFLRRKKREAGEDGNACVGDVKSLDWMRELYELIPPTHQEAPHDRIQRPYERLRTSNDESYVTLPGIFDHLPTKQRSRVRQQSASFDDIETKPVASSPMARANQTPTPDVPRHDGAVWQDSNALTSQSLTALDGGQKVPAHRHAALAPLRRAESAGKQQRVPQSVEPDLSWLTPGPRELNAEESGALHRYFKGGDSNTPSEDMKPPTMADVSADKSDARDELLGHITEAEPGTSQEEVISAVVRLQNYGEQAIQYARETEIDTAPIVSPEQTGTTDMEESRQPSAVTDATPTHRAIDGEDEMPDVNWVEEVAARDRQKWEESHCAWFEESEPDDMGPAKGSVIDIDIDKVTERLGKAVYGGKDMPLSKSFEERMREKETLEARLRKHTEWLEKVRKGQETVVPDADDVVYLNKKSVADLDEYDAGGGLAAAMEKIQKRVEQDWEQRSSLAGSLKKLLLQGEEYFSPTEAKVPEGAAQDLLASSERALRVQRHLATREFDVSSAFVHPHLARQDHRLTTSPLTSGQIRILQQRQSGIALGLPLFDMPTKEIKQLQMSTDQFDRDHKDDKKQQEGGSQPLKEVLPTSSETTTASQKDDTTMDMAPIENSVETENDVSQIANENDIVPDSENTTPAISVAGEIPSTESDLPQPDDFFETRAQSVQLGNPSPVIGVNNDASEEDFRGVGVTEETPSHVESEEKSAAEGEVEAAEQVIDQSAEAKQLVSEQVDEATAVQCTTADALTNVAAERDDAIGHIIMSRMWELDFDSEKRSSISKMLQPYRHPMPVTMRRDLDAIIPTSEEWDDMYKTTIRHSQKEKISGKAESIKNRRWVIVGLQQLVRQSQEREVQSMVCQNWSSQQKCAAEERLENRLEETAFDLFSSVNNLNKLTSFYRDEYEETFLAEKIVRIQRRLDSEAEEFTKRVAISVMQMEKHVEELKSQRKESSKQWCSVLVKEIVDVAMRQSELNTITASAIPEEMQQQVKEKFLAGAPIYPGTVASNDGWANVPEVQEAHNAAKSDQAQNSQDLQQYSNFEGKWAVIPPPAQSSDNELPDEAAVPAGALPTTDKKIGSAAAATEPITPQEDAKTVPFLGTPPPNYALTNLLLNAKKSISRFHEENELTTELREFLELPKDLPGAKASAVEISPRKQKGGTKLVKAKQADMKTAPPVEKPAMPRHAVRGAVLGKPFAGKTALLRRLRQDFPVQIITEDYLVRNAIDTFMAQERKMSEQFTKLQKRKVKWAEEVREKKERLEAAALERQKANQPEYQATESLLAAAVATNEEERPTLKQAEPSTSSLKKDRGSKDQSSSSSLRSKTSAAVRSKNRLSAVETASKTSLASLNESGTLPPPKSDVTRVSQVCPINGSIVLPTSTSLEVVQPDFSGSWLEFTPVAMIGKHALKCMSFGETVTDEEMMVLLEIELMSLSKDMGWILDGFPRTLRQAQMLVFMLSQFDSGPLQDVFPVTGSLQFLPKSPLEHKTVTLSKLLPPMQTGDFFRILNCGLDFVIHLDTPNDICCRRALGHYYRDVIRKDPDMMKAPFRPLIPDELLPLKADNVGTISHLHRRMVEYNVHFENVIQYLSIFGIVKTLDGTACTAENAARVTSDFAHYLKHIPPPIAHMKEEYKKRFQELETYLEDEKFVKKFDYKEFSALRDRGDLDDKVVSALVDHDKDYDTTEWEGYLKPMASASENVEKSHQRLLAKADVKNKKFNFAIPFFLDEQASVALLAVWRQMERDYTEIMACAMSALRKEQERVLQTVSAARNDLTTQFQLTEAEEPLKFNLVSVQRAANKFIQFAWRSSAPTDLIASFLAGMKGDLMQMVVNTSACHSDYLEAHRCWAFLEDHCGVLSNIFILMMEAELLRYRTTCSIIQDYYCIIEGRQAEKRKVADCEILQFFKIPVVQQFLDSPTGKKRIAAAATATAAAAATAAATAAAAAAAANVDAAAKPPGENTSQTALPKLDADAITDSLAVQDRSTTPSGKDKKPASRSASRRGEEAAEGTSKPSSSKGKGAKGPAKAKDSKPGKETAKSPGKKGKEKSGEERSASAVQERDAETESKQDLNPEPSGKPGAPAEGQGDTKPKLNMKYVHKASQYYHTEGSAALAPPFSPLEENTEKTMEVAGKQDVSSPAPVASEPSQQSDADLLLAMHKKALQQAQEIRKMGCEPLQKPVQPPKQPGKAEDAEEEVKAAAGKKKGGKASVAEKRKSGKSKKDPTPEPAADVPPVLTKAEKQFAVLKKRIAKVRREGLLAATIEHMQCEAHLNAIQANALEMIEWLKSKLDGLYDEIDTMRIKADERKIHCVQQVIDIFLSVVESHKPLLSKLNMAELQLELDKSCIMPGRPPVVEEQPGAERLVAIYPLSYHLKTFLRDITCQQRTSMLSGDTMDSIERRLNSTQLPEGAIPGDYDWRRRSLLYTLQSSEPLTQLALLKLTALLRSADNTSSHLLSNTAFCQMVSVWLKSCTTTYVMNAGGDGNRHDNVVAHIAQTFAQEDGMIPYLSVLFFMCAADTRQEGFLRAVSIASLEIIDTKSLPGQPEVMWKTNIHDGDAHVDAINLVLTNRDLNMYRQGRSHTESLTCEEFQFPKMEPDDSLPEAIMKPYGDYLERRRKLFPDKYEDLPTLVPLEDVMQHSTVQDFIATCPILQWKGFRNSVSN